MKERKNRCRKKVIRNRKIICFMAGSICIVIFMCCLVFNTFLVSAHGNATEKAVEYTYYKSIVIKSGDTLWDIAKEHMPTDCESVEEYVKTLKELNSLTSDEIQAGQNLVIAYKDTEFIK